MNAGKVIYDFGSNNGDDIPYYLMKAGRVVAVEANSVLCAQIRSRFHEAIRDGRLVVENCVLDVAPARDAVPFHIHRANHVLSQFPKPPEAQSSQFEGILLPSRNVVDLVRHYGEPFYVKCDLEQFDQAILGALFAHGIRPPYISAESHGIEVFATLLALGGYRAFKLVDGASVSTKYRDAGIRTEAGLVKYSFPHHSAGPFGEDVRGPWMTPDNFFRLLGWVGLGWKDIHATSVEAADPDYAPQPRVQFSVDY